MIKVTLKDGKVLRLKSSKTAYEIACEISEGLARIAACARKDGEIIDLRSVIAEDCVLEIVTVNEPEGLEVLRHTASHVLAEAVKKIFPTTKLAIGPATATGFYYDFEFKSAKAATELAALEKEMEKIIKADAPIERFVSTRWEALGLMDKYDEPYKTELINALPEGAEITFYKQGNFIDLCKGPHLMKTGQVKAFKLTSLTGAYWRGDEKNKMLSRIYGTAFPKKSILTEHLAAVELAKTRDHNKIGRELGYFTTSNLIGQGLPLIMPKGAKTLQIMQRYVEDLEEEYGYKRTMTPSLAKSDLYKTSGHWSHYRDGMFVIGDETRSAEATGSDGESEEVFALRPMTCPFQFEIYKNGLKSYRDLPVRYAETAHLFRKEASGEMHGLIRVRQFTLSDGHIICSPKQVESEFSAALSLVYKILEDLGLKEDVTFRFSRWDATNKEKYIDAPELWEKTESDMRVILKNLGVEFKEAVNEAAFYGPKLDVQIKNVYGKEDTIITLQIDFALAERFGMTFVDEDGEKKSPMIIHRSSIGCYERTLALLIEKYGGAMPLWLSAEQVKVLPVTDKNTEYAESAVKKLRACGIRAVLDDRNETIGYKIRAAQVDKVPYMAVVGGVEAENGTVSVRSLGKGDMGAVKFDDFIQNLLDEINRKG